MSSPDTPSFEMVEQLSSSLATASTTLMMIHKRPEFARWQKEMWQMSLKCTEMSAALSRIAMLTQSEDDPCPTKLTTPSRPSNWLPPA